MPAPQNTLSRKNCSGSVFKELAELSIWDRVCAGASALAAVGGAVAILAKLDDIIDKIRGVIKSAQAMGKKVVVKAGQALGIDCPFGLACFARGTPVLLACGALVPIEMIELGDLVACEQMVGVEDANRLIAEELGLSGPDDALICGEVVLSAADGVTVDVTLLRSQSWWDAATLDGGVVALDLPELGVSGIGELVRTWEFETPLDFGNCEARPVIALICTSSAPVLELELSNGEMLLVTEQHPFRVPEHAGWIAAGRLRVGCALDSLEKGAQVQVVRHAQRPQQSAVYNFEVADAHSYRVGHCRALVHNTCILKPHPDAVGPHCTFKRGANGEISNYVEWTPNPRNPTGFDEVKRVDVTGKPHFDKKTGREIPTPHTKDKAAGVVRPATPDEIPGGG